MMDEAARVNRRELREGGECESLNWRIDDCALSISQHSTSSTSSVSKSKTLQLGARQAPWFDVRSLDLYFSCGAPEVSMPELNCIRDDLKPI